jgi:teichoic acid transport system ATP-binding protein
MSSKIAINVENLSKVYEIYDKPKDRLKQTLFRGKKKFFREFKAINNISFNVKKGSTIGIIGKNGSGKSTLLQILTQTLQPTSGEVYIKGRISALLELGNGFNPEFTGKENAIMNGTIMGLSEKEIINRLPQIEKFADIGDFIDQPVKVYSSGMFVRLAFACAVNVDPDILIIDEALAVGDMQFQLKCIEKMKEFKRSGKTILFVSHDMYSVRNFCDEVIWMMNGQIHQRGEVISVTKEYEDYMKELSDVPVSNSIIENNKNNNEGNILSIDEISVIDTNNNLKSDFNFGENLAVEISYTIHEPKEGIVGGVAIFDKLNNYVCGLNTKLDNVELPSKAGKYKLKINYHDVLLLPNRYYLDVGFFESSGLARLDYKTRVNDFKIHSSDYFAEGLTLIKHKWEVEN